MSDREDEGMDKNVPEEENETMDNGELKEIEPVEQLEVINNIIFKCRCRFLTVLYPSQFMNPVKGIKQVLNSCILTYISAFEGVLLYYKKVKSITVAVPHIDSLPYSYFSGEADLYMFRPILGTNIVAEVASIEFSNEIVTVLIKGCFNGRVSASKDILKDIAVGQYIRFKVTSTFYKRGNYVVLGDYIDTIVSEEE